MTRAGRLASSRTIALTVPSVLQTLKSGKNLLTKSMGETTMAWRTAYPVLSRNSSFELSVSGNSVGTARNGAMITIGSIVPTAKSSSVSTHRHTSRPVRRLSCASHLMAAVDQQLATATATAN